MLKLCCNSNKFGARNRNPIASSAIFHRCPTRQRLLKINGTALVAELIDSETSSRNPIDHSDSAYVESRTLVVHMRARIGAMLIAARRGGLALRRDRWCDSDPRSSAETNSSNSRAQKILEASHVIQTQIIAGVGLDAKSWPVDESGWLLSPGQSHSYKRLNRRRRRPFSPLTFTTAHSPPLQHRPACGCRPLIHRLNDIPSQSSESSQTLTLRRASCRSPRRSSSACSARSTARTG